MTAGGARAERLDHGLVRRMHTEAGRHADVKNFRPRVLELPAMLQRSGLAATLVYLTAKDEPGRKVAAVLAGELAGRPGPEIPDTPVELADWTARADLADLVVVQQHARLTALWLKRMVEALHATTPAGAGTAAPAPDADGDGNGEASRT